MTHLPVSISKSVAGVQSLETLLGEAVILLHSVSAVVPGVPPPEVHNASVVIVKKHSVSAVPVPGVPPPAVHNASVA